jgi:hypothetical protein
MFQQTSFIELDLPPRFGDWLAGFVDGEGYFGLRCRAREDGGKRIEYELKIGLRDDDLAILEYIHDTLNIGRIYRREPNQGNGNRNPEAMYIVRRKSDLKHVIIPLFEQHPLKAKKKRDFGIWKQAVEIAMQFSGGRGNQIPCHLWQQAKQLEAELKATRAYAPSNGRL